MAFFDTHERRTLFFGSLIVLVLYLGFNGLVNRLQGVGVTRYLQYVATMVLGSGAFTGGRWSALVGLVVQGLASTLLTLGFVLTARYLRWLVGQPILGGLVWGVTAYVLMTWIVQPLSAMPFTSVPTLANILVGVGVYVGCVGWPLAFIASWLQARTSEG